MNGHDTEGGFWLTMISVFVGFLSSFEGWLSSHASTTGFFMSIIFGFVGLYIQWRRLKILEKQEAKNE